MNEVESFLIDIAQSVTLKVPDKIWFDSAIILLIYNVLKQKLDF